MGQIFPLFWSPELGIGGESQYRQREHDEKLTVASALLKKMGERSSATTNWGLGFQRYRIEPLSQGRQRHLGLLDEAWRTGMESMRDLG